MGRHVCVIIALLFASASTAQGQLDAAVRRCIDGYNNKLRLVSQQAGKSARACIRNAARGNENAPDGCIVANTDGKIAGKEAKVAALYSGGKCDGSEPIQRGATAGNAAHRAAVTDLVHDLFGDPVTSAVVGLGSDDAKCVDMAMKRAVQAFAAVAKGHRQCKKTGLQSGAVVDEATLDVTCGTLSQIDVAGKAQYRLSKLAQDVGAACAAPAVGLATLFPGLDAPCHADAAALGTCVAARTSCRACLALNEADGQHMDCDLIDDGADNDSCYAFALGSHTCTFAAGSELFLRSALPLSLAITGSATVSCGTTDAAQASACSCTLNTVGPLVVPAIGDFCISPAAGCPAGGIDCDGGPARDVDMNSNHNAGACTSNADCAATCDAYCGALGAGYLRRASSCESFCQGGANDELACTQESDCPGGDCVGKPPFHGGGICNCICDGLGLGAPSGAGALDCTVGFQLRVELPSNGVCGDAVVETLPPRCVGMTTATATGQNHNANNMMGSDQPSFGSTASGTALACSAIEGGSLTGLELVGHTVFFDTTLGDNFGRLSIVCQ
jgi:hypothetical protein